MGISDLLPDDGVQPKAAGHLGNLQFKGNEKLGKNGSGVRIMQLTEMRRQVESYEKE